jgi:3-hydroxyacyl-CoA dehydrogenase
MRRELDGFIMNRLQGALLHEAFRLVAEGYASSEDVDARICKGIGLRWAFMGPFETIDLNAPGGNRDYVDRYGGLYRNLAPGGKTRHSARRPHGRSGLILSKKRLRRSSNSDSGDSADHGLGGGIDGGAGGAMESVLSISARCAIAPQIEPTKD